MPKSRSGFREINIPDMTLEAINDYLPLLKTDILFPGARSGKIMSKTSQRKFWEAIMHQIRMAAGEEPGTHVVRIDGLCQYTFRHNYCTVLYYSGVSLLEAVRLMGHRDYKMIMKVYAHLDAQNEKTAEKLKEVSF